MRDGMIKATGNSWNLKSVPDFLTLYPTYEAFVQALTDGTLPVDLNGMNPAGWSQMGTMLNKANLLKDATAALYGLGAEAVPDEVLAKAGALMNAVNGSLAVKAWFAHGAYIGSGSGSTEKTLNCNFLPSLVLIQTSRDTGAINGLGWTLAGAARDSVAGFQMGYGQGGSSNDVRGGALRFGWSDNSVVIPGGWNIAPTAYRYFVWG